MSAILKSRTKFFFLGALVSLGTIFVVQVWLNRGKGPSSYYTPPWMIFEDDYFYKQDTFSEVEASRRRIEAECSRFLIGYRTALAPFLNPSLVRKPTTDEERRDFEEKWQVRLQEALKLYQGLPEEFQVLNAYLHFTRRRQDHEAFLDAYIDALYRHPGEMVMGTHAHYALRIAGQCDRADPLVEALHRVVCIPVKLKSQDNVRAALETWKSQPEN